MLEIIAAGAVAVERNWLVERDGLHEFQECRALDQHWDD
jgi:hypothetical protein